MVSVDFGRPPKWDDSLFIQWHGCSHKQIEKLERIYMKSYYSLLRWYNFGTTTILYLIKSAKIYLRK